MVEILIVLAVPVMSFAVGYAYGRKQEKPDFKYPNKEVIDETQV